MTLIGDNVELESAYEVFVDGFLVYGVTYANEHAGIVRYRTGTGEEVEILDDVAIRLAQPREL